MQEGGRSGEGDRRKGGGKRETKGDGERKKGGWEGEMGEGEGRRRPPVSPSLRATLFIFCIQILQFMYTNT